MPIVKIEISLQDLVRNAAKKENLVMFRINFKAK